MKTLTRAEIQAFPSSGELDAHVAEKVMGWTDCFGTGGQLLAIGATEIWRGRPPGNLLIGEAGTPVVPPFSSSIAEAWKVMLHVCRKQPEETWDEQVNAVLNDGGWGDSKEYHDVVMERCRYWENTWEIQVNEGKTFVIFSRPSEGHRIRGFSNVDTLEELPLAICRAALLTSMDPPEEA